MRVVLTLLVEWLMLSPRGMGIFWNPIAIAAPRSGGKFLLSIVNFKIGDLRFCVGTPSKVWGAPHHAIHANGSKSGEAPVIAHLPFAARSPTRPVTDLPDCGLPPRALAQHPRPGYIRPRSSVQARSIQQINIPWSTGPGFDSTCSCLDECPTLSYMWSMFRLHLRLDRYSCWPRSQH